MKILQETYVLWLLLCAHLLGDFLLQPARLAECKSKPQWRKNKTWLYVLLHGLIYSVCVFLLLLPYMSGSLAIAGAIISVSHLLIDFIKVWWSGKQKNAERKRYVFLFDQFIHIAIIFIIAYFYAIRSTVALNMIGVALQKFYHGVISGISVGVLLRIGFVVLLNLKPANVFIRLWNVKRGNEPEPGAVVVTKKELEYKDAGKLIGILERLLIITMVVLNQYAAIGLIFTAKSITRYEKIIKEPAFAEYYLVGTLLSVGIAVVSALLI